MKIVWSFLSGCLLVVWMISCGGDSSEKSVVASNTSIQISEQAKANEQARIDDPLVAEWNGGKLFLSDIDKILGSQKEQLIANSSNDAHIRDLLLGKRQATIKILVDNYILIKEVNARKMSLTESQLEDVIREIRSKYDSEEEYLAELENTGQSEADLVQALANVRLGLRCVEEQQKKIASSLTPEILKAYYDSHLKEQFSPPACSKVNWVIIKSIKSGDKFERTVEEAKQFATKLYSDVKKKVEALETLEEKRKVLQQCARTYSDDYSGKYNYGYAILYHRDPAWSAYTKAFRDELVKRNKPAELSDVVEVMDSSYGFFILLNKSSSFVSSFDSPAVQNMLPNMVIQEKLEEWLDELKTKYEFKLYEENLTYLSGSSLDTDQS